MAEVAERLTDLGVEVVSLYWGEPRDSAFMSLMRSACTEVIASPRVMALRREWAKRRPDFVMAFGMRASLFTRFCSPTDSRRGLVAMARNGLDYQWSRSLNVVDRLTQGRVDVYVANSQAVADSLQARGIHDPKVRVVRSALPAGWSSRPTSGKDPRLFAMVGNSRPEKNHEFGVEAFAAARIPATLRVYTDDGSVSLGIWKRMLHRNPDAKLEVVEGHRLAPEDYDPVAVLLHPSLSESLPRTVLEARARGCFVIASDVGDVASAITGGGIIPHSFDIGEWSTAIQRAYRHAASGVRFPRTVPGDTANYADALMEALHVR